MPSFTHKTGMTHFYIYTYIFIYLFICIYLFSAVGLLPDAVLILHATSWSNLKNKVIMSNSVSFSARCERIDV